MSKLLRLFALLLFAVTAQVARPADAAIPTCYSNLPHHQVADPTWRYSHQCREGTTLWYVYIDRLNRWHLVGTNVPP